MTSPVAQPANHRETQRLKTRERVFDAAVTEFKRVGVADADINAIVATAGVVRGTFYFHFPSKEHALADLARREEASVCAELASRLRRNHDLRSALSMVIEGIVAEENRLGHLLFRDVLSLYFSTDQPDLHDSATHPIVLIVIDRIETARARGEIFAGADAESTSVFFLIGVYGLLATNRDASPARQTLLDSYLDHFCRGLGAR